MKEFDSTVAASGQAPLAGPSRELPEVSDQRYAIGAEVGRGGIGRVVKARDEVLERQVALKQLFATDEGSRRRFLREVLITARLQHPSIVPVYDAGRREDDSPFYAMKLVAGQPLEREIAATTTLEDRLALVPTVLAVADAIAYAHNERVIHRDLKPANVLVGKFGETVVIDWGLAKDLSIDDRDALPVGPYRSAANDAHTVAGSVMGTPGYMAPEQAAGEEADERADVYAIGAVLYHVISGIAPHQGTTIDEVIAKVIRGDIRPVVEREPRTPPDLATIVSKAMAVDKAARYRNASELADDLRKFQTGKLVGAHRYTRGERIKRWVKRNRAIALVTVIATIVLVVVATLSIRRIIAESDEATKQRDEAVANTNRAYLNQARSLRDEPARMLAILGRMDDTAPGWQAARILAGDGLAQPMLVAQTRGPDGAVKRWLGFMQLEVSRERVIAFDSEGLWIMDLGAMSTKQVPYPRHQDGLRRLALCDDGKRAYLLSGAFYGDTTFSELDVDTGVLHPREGHNEAYVAAVEACRRSVPNKTEVTKQWFTPDRKHVIALDRTGSLRRFDLAGTELGVVVGPEPAIPVYRDELTRMPTIEAAISNDGKAVITRSGSTYTFWSFTHGRYDVKLEPTETGAGIAIAPDGSVAYVATSDHGYEIFDRPYPLKEVAAQVPHGQLAMSPDGAWLVGTTGGSVTIVDRATHTRRLLRGHPGVSDIAFTRTGELVTVGGEAVRMWKLGEPGRSHGLLGIRAAAFSSDGKWLALDSGRTVARWNVALGAIDATIEHPLSHVSIAISNTGEAVLATEQGVFRWVRGGPLQLIGKHAANPSIAMLPDGTPITVTHDRVVIWAAQRREIRLPGKGLTRIPAASPFVMDARGSRLLIVCRPQGEDQTTCLVELASGKVTPLPRSTTLAAISPDGRIGLTSIDREDYAVWDLDRVAYINELHSVGVVTEVGISSDGLTGLVGGHRGIDVIDLTTFRVTAIAASERTNGGQLRWSPDNKTVVGQDLSLRDVETGEVRKTAQEDVSGPPPAFYLSSSALTVVTGFGISTTPDDLPRDPATLKRQLLELPYSLDDYTAVSVTARAKDSR